MNRLKKEYKEKIAPKMIKDLDLKNVMGVPTVKKIKINAGIGSFRENREAVESFEQELSDIAGQKAVPTKARLSEAGFKIRKGDIVGYTVTLRGDKMWAFLDKLINIAIPRVRDFRGLNLKSFDDNGNYSLGIKEHTIFPEVNANKTKGIRNLQLTIVTNSNNKEHNEFLLRELGMPFKE
jgi:large subunit ribosomal protein L5